MLSARLRTSLLAYGPRTVVEDAGGQWRLTGDDLLRAVAALARVLAPHAQRPLVAYLRKGPLYYTFLACAFLHRLDFCPLDADNPTRRVLDIADQLEGAVILCDGDETFARLRAHAERCMRLEFAPSDANPEGAGDLPPGRGRYYIATSGSTGVPKLVQVPHDRTVSFLDWAIPFYALDAASRWGQFSSIGFDLSLVDFLVTACGGGTLVSLAAAIDRMRPAHAVIRGRLTHWHSVPSMIPYFLREPPAATPSTCRLFTFCGEPFMRADAEGLAARYPGARIINTYGPTETTLFCSFFEFSPDLSDPAEPTLPIGMPIPSWQFVLAAQDEGFRLFILSDNVADGYVGVSAPQFATLSLFGHPVRAFDTGDYVRRVGGHLHFSHRIDSMIKLNGLRIDLGEIEAAAKRCGFLNPVALVCGKTLALVVEASAEATADLGGLAAYLPRASLPSQVQLVPAHPRTQSGKLDRRAIREAFEAIHAS